MNIRFTFLLLAVLSFTAFSCSKDDEGPSGSDHSAIVGTWIIDSVHIEYNENGEIEKQDFGGDEVDYTELVFKSDNTCTQSYISDNGNKETVTGTYSLKDGKLSLKMDTEEGTPPPYFYSDMAEVLCSIDGQNMKWSWYAKVSDVGNTIETTFDIYFIKK